MSCGACDGRKYHENMNATKRAYKILEATKFDERWIMQAIQSSYQHRATGSANENGTCYQTSQIENMHNHICSRHSFQQWFSVRTGSRRAAISYWSLESMIDRRIRKWIYGDSTCEPAACWWIINNTVGIDAFVLESIDVCPINIHAHATTHVTRRNGKSIENYTLASITIWSHSFVTGELYGWAGAHSTYIRRIFNRMGLHVQPINVSNASAPSALDRPSLRRTDAVMRAK